MPDELFQRLRDDSGTLSAVLALDLSRDVLGQLDLTVEGEDFDTGASSLNYEFVTGDYFQVLGLVEPAAGRLLIGSDDRPGAAPVAVISHRLWVGRFGGSPDVIDSRISLENPVGLGFPEVMVVGVAPPGFFGTYIDMAPDVWLPFQVGGRRDPELLGGPLDTTLEL